MLQQVTRLAHSVGQTWATVIQASLLAALQVQALAVCTTWKSYLDPKLWPIEELHVDASAKKGIGFRILRWIASTQPAVRSLTMNRFQAPPLLSTLTSIAHSTVRPITA